MKKVNNSEIDSTLFITLLKALTSKITALVGYSSKNFIKFIFPLPVLMPWITLALRANMPVRSSVALGGWIIDESLVKKTFPISEYTNLLAMVIGTSKFLFRIFLISLSGDPVAFKILFNFLVDLPSLAKVFKEFTLIVIENILYVILISSAALAFEITKNGENTKIKNILNIKNLLIFI